MVSKAIGKGGGDGGWGNIGDDYSGGGGGGQKINHQIK